MANISTSPDKKIAVTGGTIIIDDTSAITGLTGICIEATEDTTISVCTGLDASGGSFNFKTSALTNWETLKAGDRLYTKDNYQINEVTLTSGRVLVHQF